MAYSGYSSDTSDTDQNNSPPLPPQDEKTKSKIKPKRRNNNNRKRFARMRKSWRFMKMRKLWERDMSKQRRISAPLMSIKANNKQESMTASLLFIFAMVQCICGFVLPICDSFGMKGVKPRVHGDHKYYLEIFLISQYCGAVLLLAYLQLLIQIGTKKQAKCSDSNKSTKSNNSCQLADNKNMIINERHELTVPNLTLIPSDVNHSPTASNSDKISDIESTTSERQYTPLIQFYNNKNVYISWHPEGMNLYMRLGAVGFGLGVMIHDGFNLSSVWEVSAPICHSKLWIPKHIIRIIWVLWQTYFVFKYHRVIFHKHRVAVRFAYAHLATINFCHWLKVVVGEVAQTLKTTNPSHPIQMIKLSTGNHNYTHNLFTLKNSLSNTGDTLKQLTNDENTSNICFSSYSVILGPFLFPLAIEYSLIAGSFFYKMLQRVDRNFPKTSYHISERLGQNSPSLLSSSPPSTANSISKNMFGKFNSPLLFPDVDDEEVVLDEYFHRQCSKHMTYKPVMGCKMYLPMLQQNKLPILNQDAEEPSDDNPSLTTDDNKKTSTDRKSLKLYSGHQCHRSHSGLFLGIMLLIASSVCMVLFIVHGSKGSMEFASFIYQQSRIALSFTSLLACIMAILQTNQLKFRRLGHGESFEYNLLTVGLIGCITYHIFLFIPAFETVLHILLFKSIDLEDHVDIEKADDKTIHQNLNATYNQTRIVQITPSDIYYIALLYSAKCTLEIFQALLQFFFIVESSRRKVCCLNQALIKPGRSVIVFLLICNLALWLVNTFEVRRAETQLSLYIKYFGVRTWSVITYCFIPLIIFFRFHSTVCLAELWTKLYKLT